MVARRESTWIAELGLAQRSRSELILQEKDLVGEHVPAAHAQSLRRAWTALGLAGIWCLSGRPIALFKTFDDENGEELSEFHRYVWNQATTPLAVAITRRSIYVFSAYALPDKAAVAEANDARALTVLARISDALEAGNFARDVERGRTFADANAFKPAHRADQYLLGNLLALRRLLISDAAMEARQAEQLLLQTVFICYLNDRQLLRASHLNSTESFSDFLSVGTPQAASRRMLGLLQCLHREFNGDFFGSSESGVPQASIPLLRGFLAGEVLDTGQTALGFWAYDFSAIPVEMLSEIYQAFLSDDPGTDRRKLGAYYTPRFLADVVLDVALQKEPLTERATFLDPACGSGIFLVAAFNRLAEQYRRDCGDARLPNPAHFRKLLVENIFGVDISGTACRITALSLHLALLDQLPETDVEALGERGSVLPKLLSGADGLRNIDESDFFSLKVERWPHGFDYIVGNPPWVRVSTKDTSALLRWTAENDVPIAQRQAAYGFIFKALQHLTEVGTSCLLVPSSVLLNRQERNLEALHRLFSKASVTDVINLADLCYLLFEDASRAPAIFRYRPARPSVSTLTEYASVKADLPALRAGVLSIDRDDTWSLRNDHIIDDLTNAKGLPLWKVRLWATRRDVKLLEKLNTYPSLGHRVAAKAGWSIGEGFNTKARGEERDRAFLHGMPYLPSESLRAFAVPRAALHEKPPTFSPKQSGDERIYRAPHLLIPRGAPRRERRMRVAFAGYDCSFQHAIRAIAVARDDADELRLLACILCAPVTTYFLFHTAASWGVERAQVHRAEYERLPYPPPSGGKKRTARDIVKLHRAIEAAILGGGYGHEAEAIAGEIDVAVAKYYELEDAEIALIEDTLELSIPSATPTSTNARAPMSQPASEAERAAYLDELVSAFDWLEHPPAVRLRVVSPRFQLAVTQLSIERGTRPTQMVAESHSQPALEAVLGRLKTLLPDSAGSVLRQRDLKVFSGTELFLVKDLAKRHWSRSAALNDADEIATAVLSDEG